MPTISDPRTEMLETYRIALDAISQFTEAIGRTSTKTEMEEGLARMEELKMAITETTICSGCCSQMCPPTGGAAWQQCYAQCIHGGGICA